MRVLSGDCGAEAAMTELVIAHKIGGRFICLTGAKAIEVSREHLL